MKLKGGRLRVFFFTVERSLKHRMMSLRTKIIKLDATVMPRVKYGSKAYSIRKTEGVLLDFFLPEKMRLECFGYPTNLPYLKE